MKLRNINKNKEETRCWWKHRCPGEYGTIWCRWHLWKGDVWNWHLTCAQLLRRADSWWSHGLQPSRLLTPWDFLGKNTGVGHHTLLQGILDNMSNFWTFEPLDVWPKAVSECDLWMSGAEERMKLKSSRTERRTPNPCFPHFGFWLPTCFSYMNVYIINNRICFVFCLVFGR